MQTIVVTGGAGFIGSNIVSKLTEKQEYNIVVCDWHDESSKWRNLSTANVNDIIAPENLIDFLSSTSAVTTVIHMGAISDTTETNVDRLLKQNTNYTLDLWRWCRTHDIRLIYASSAATYGAGSYGFDDDPASKLLEKLCPLNPYAWSKHLVDRCITTDPHAQLQDSQWVGLKFFNVFGPGEGHKGAMRSVALQIYETITSGHTPQLFRSHRSDYQDGEQKRDFIYVKDCVDVILWLLDHAEISGLFNLGSGHARSFNELARAVFSALDREPLIEYCDTPLDIRTRYQYFTEAKMGRLRSSGYTKPFTSLELGISTYVKDYLEKSNNHP